MPLVSPNNDGIDIPFTSSADQLVAESKRAVSEIDKVKDATRQKGKELEEQAKREQEAVKKSSNSWTEFRSMYSTVLDVVKVGQAVWAETGQKFIDNTIAMGDFSRSIGTTIEEAARLKEVADDVGIGTDTLRTSLKLAAKDGFTPTIDGIARMADEYNKLAPGVERTQFLLDRFGKSGEEMGKLLEKGGQSIKDMAAAMDESLIPTEKAYQQARQYQISVDALKDSWDALTYKAAPPLVSAVTSVTNRMRDTLRVEELLEEQGVKLQYATIKQKDAAYEQAAAEREQADAALLAKKSAEEGGEAFEAEAEKAKRLADEAKAAADAIKEMTKANQDYLKNIEETTKSTDDFRKKQSDLRIENRELLAEKQKLIAQGWWVESDAVKKVDEKLEENRQKMQDNADEFELAGRRKILSMLEQQLAVDGLDAKETEFLLTQGLQWGVYSQEAVEAAQAAQREVDALINKFNAIPTYKEVTIQVQTLGGYQQGTTQYNNIAHPARASGGPVMAGTPYMVGERGPELFTPTQSGNISSNKDTQSMFSFDYNRLGDVVASALSQALQRYG